MEATAIHFPSFPGYSPQRLLSVCARQTQRDQRDGLGHLSLANFARHCLELLGWSSNIFPLNLGHLKKSEDLDKVNRIWVLTVNHLINMEAVLWKSGVNAGKQSCFWQSDLTNISVGWNFRSLRYPLPVITRGREWMADVFSIQASVLAFLNHPSLGLIFWWF